MKSLTSILKEYVSDTPDDFNIQVGQTTMTYKQLIARFNFLMNKYKSAITIKSFADSPQDNSAELTQLVTYILAIAAAEKGQPVAPTVKIEVTKPANPRPIGTRLQGLK